MAKNKSDTNWWLAALVLAALFLIAYFSRQHVEIIRKFVESRPIFGITFYLLVGIFDAMLGPGVSIPLIPVAARIWGGFWTGSLTLAGWVTGSALAFWLVRIYGRKFAKYLVSPDKLNKIKEHLPENLFEGIILFRLVFPMDIFSYALGLFTDISFSQYFLATILGVAPSAFLLAYVGRLPLAFEVATYVIGAGLFVWLAKFVQKILKQKPPEAV